MDVFQEHCELVSAIKTNRIKAFFNNNFKPVFLLYHLNKVGYQIKSPVDFEECHDRYCVNVIQLTLSMQVPMEFQLIVYPKK
jgi:hypothetical protein